jgi:DNA-binding transcriptional LysR family regulator
MLALEGGDRRVPRSSSGVPSVQGPPDCGLGPERDGHRAAGHPAQRGAFRALGSTADYPLALHESRCVQHEEQRHEECRDQHQRKCRHRRGADLARSPRAECGAQGANADGHQQVDYANSGPLVVHDYSSMLDTALAGAAMAQVPEPIAREHVQAGRLDFPNRKQVSPKLRAFIDHARSFVAARDGGKKPGRQRNRTT